MATKRFAEGTTVPVEKTRGEIERLLTRYGATGFGYMWQGVRQLVAFEAHGKHLRFALTLPDRREKRFTHRADRPWQELTEGAQLERYDAEVRRLWRALLLIIKAKLEVVESGIETFEEAFLANIVLADNTTMAEWAIPQLEQQYGSGRMPGILPQPGGALALGPGQ